MSRPNPFLSFDSFTVPRAAQWWCRAFAFLLAATFPRAIDVYPTNATIEAGTARQ